MRGLLHLAALEALLGDDRPVGERNVLTGEVEHYETPRPLTKRQKRRLRGKASA